MLTTAEKWQTMCGRVEVHHGMGTPGRSAVAWRFAR